MTDDHAKNATSIYGNKLINTPNIDRIGKEGVTFTNAFVTNSICGPSRATFLTGKYSHINGYKDNRDLHFDGSQWTYPKELQNAGYYTAMIGKWHLGSYPTGFDFWKILVNQGEYYNPRFIEQDHDTVQQMGYTTEILTDLAMKIIDSVQGRPFCIMLHQKAPHRNWMPDAKYFHLFDSDTLPMPDNYFDDYATRSLAAKQQDMEVRNLYLSYDLKLYLNEGEEDPGSGGSERFAQQAKEAWEHSLNRLTREQREAWDSYYKPISDEFYRNKLTGKKLEQWKYQRYIKDYLRCIVSVDDNVGILLDYLQKKGLLDNTIIIYTSDQGFFLGEHGWYDKRFMYEESIGIPFLMRYPKLFKPGTVKNEIVLNLDLAPTLLDILHLPIPEDVQGESMMALFNPQTENRWRKSMYYHYYEYPYGWHKVKRHYGIRTERYKLIHFYNDIDAWELYDLKNDPHEMVNLYGDSRYTHTVDTLKKDLYLLQKKYKDDLQD